MDLLQLALVVMISVWTLVSIGAGVLVWMLIAKVNEVIDRLNKLLETTQGVATDVRAPVQAVADSVREVFAPLSSPTPLVR